VNESKECEHFWFLLSPLAPVHGRIPAELQQPRLLRMKFQIELRQSFPKLVQEALGISLILKCPQWSGFTPRRMLRMASLFRPMVRTP
jgi:hypothetical protein